MNLAELTGELVCYGRSVVNDEWGLMRLDTLGDHVNPWGVELFRTVQTVEPETAAEQSAYDKWLDQTSDRELARQERVHGAVGVIPTVAGFGGLDPVCSPFQRLADRRLPSAVRVRCASSRPRPPGSPTRRPRSTWRRSRSGRCVRAGANRARRLLLPALPGRVQAGDGRLGRDHASTQSGPTDPFRDAGIPARRARSLNSSRRRRSPFHECANEHPARHQLCARCRAVRFCTVLCRHEPENAFAPVAPVPARLRNCHLHRDGCVDDHVPHQHLDLMDSTGFGSGLVGSACLTLAAHVHRTEKGT
jgi:hypothetical protein